MDYQNMLLQQGLSMNLRTIWMIFFLKIFLIIEQWYYRLRLLSFILIIITTKSHNRLLIIVPAGMWVRLLAGTVAGVGLGWVLMKITTLTPEDMARKVNMSMSRVCCAWVCVFCVWKALEESWRYQKFCHIPKAYCRLRYHGVSCGRLEVCFTPSCLACCLE